MARRITIADTTFIAAEPGSVKAQIAGWWLADTNPTNAQSAAYSLGQITLRPHQHSAVIRISTAIAEFGGALLCDEVGTGKTFIALAVARKAQSILVVAPASLHDMWHHAARKAGLAILFTSFEKLSRANATTHHTDFLIVDEAHHARNTKTRRYTRLSALAMNTPTLLVSATPIHNHRGDLSALTALFLGSRSLSISDGDLSRCVIRRDRATLGDSDGLPCLEIAQWCMLNHDDALPAVLLGLPPPLPPRNGGDGGVLIARSLIRQWASSDAALAGGLRRRLQKSVALIAGLEKGVYPSNLELSAWAGADDSMQLAFPQIVATPIDSSEALLEVARKHCDAVRAIYQTRKGAPSRDHERVAALTRIAASHPGIPVVAFSQYADTITGLYRAFTNRRHVAALTADGGRVAGGRISRCDVLARFAPSATGVLAPGDADRISLLLTTDLLSEGVNLQDAGVVVHLDIPWTAARLQQRIGRIVRLASPHRQVWSYALKPPASAEALLRIEQIIAEKLRVTNAEVGESGPVLPQAGSITAHWSASSLQADPLSAPALCEATRSVLTKWLQPCDPLNCGTSVAIAPAPLANVPVSAIAASNYGFLAACSVAGQRVLLTTANGHITPGFPGVRTTLALFTDDPARVSAAALRKAVAQLTTYFHLCNAITGISEESLWVTRVRNRVLRKISMVIDRAPLHSRHRTAEHAERARVVVMSNYGAAAEQSLCALASLQLDDTEWLLAIEAFGADHLRTGIHPVDEVSRIVALILLQRPDGT